MSQRRDIRRLAMQVLYQFDLRGEADREAIRQGLGEGPDSPEVRAQGFALAEAAWADHSAADALAQEFAAQWPTHRQPPVDRAILRLAYHEMAAGYSPVKVAINEAVELAKEYSSQQSPAFINGVLDKMARKITPAKAPEPAPPSADQWLRDALADAPPPPPAPSEEPRASADEPG